MSKTILIVDDDPGVRSLLQTSFGKTNFSVQTAENGSDALRKAQATRPDLILLDLVLPDMDGFSVCESLKKHRQTRSIPILVLSGLGNELCCLTALECGADGYIAKPFHLPHLITQVNKLLQPCSLAQNQPSLSVETGEMQTKDT